MKEINITTLVRSVGYDELSAEDRRLVDAAKDATKGSYAPYSQFKVGAAILLENGEIAIGANQENAAYPSGICAERTAVCKAVSEGHRNFVRIAIWGDGENYCMPCGACRQFMSEFSYDMDVISAKGNGEYLSLKLYELMPHAFNTENLNSLSCVASSMAMTSYS